MIYKLAHLQVTFLWTPSYRQPRWRQWGNDGKALTRFMLIHRTHMHTFHIGLMEPVHSRRDHMSRSFHLAQWIKCETKENLEKKKKKVIDLDINL